MPRPTEHHAWRLLLAALVTIAAGLAAGGSAAGAYPGAEREGQGQADRIGLAPREKLVPRDVVVDDDGTVHTRYDRTFDGLPVVGGDFVVHTRANGDLYDVSRAHEGPVAVASTQPVVTSGEARRLSRERVRLRGERTDAELVVYAAGPRPRLAWDTVTSGIRADGMPSRLHTFVDARTGKELARWDDIRSVDDGTGHSIYAGTVAIGTTATENGYRMRDTGRGGTVTLNGDTGLVFMDADDVWGDGTQADAASAGVDVHWGATQMWDYLADRHDRLGVFGDGRGTRLYAHEGNNFANAFWNDATHTAHFGDGADGQTPFVELDIVAHELGHGVVQSTAGLRGGLSEAIPDMLATGAEWHANSPENTPDYLLGEEIGTLGRGDGGPLRSMARPSIACWSEDVVAAEVHAAAGPANHWFYLASEGSGAKMINGVPHDSATCDGSSVTGVGHAKIEDIIYRALTVYMTSNESYPKARDDTIQATIDLYGPDSRECATVETAWDAVDVPYLSVSCARGGKFLRAPAPRRSTGSDRARSVCDPMSGSGPCDPRGGAMEGVLSEGERQYLPGPNGYFSVSDGVLSARLDGPVDADFDLVLQKYSGSEWVTVEQSLAPGSVEEIRYQATRGYYSWVVTAFSGTGRFRVSTN